MSVCGRRFCWKASGAKNGATVFSHLEVTVYETQRCVGDLKLSRQGTKCKRNPVELDVRNSKASRDVATTPLGINTINGLALATFPDLTCNC